MTGTAIWLRYARGRGLSSRLIEWFSHGAGWSHVDALVGMTGYPAALGARFQGGVQVRPIDYLGPRAITEVLAVPCTPEQYAAFYGFLCEQIGKPYDWTAIAAFATGHEWRDPTRWFCSELVTAAEEHAGILPRLTTPHNKITPDDSYLLNTTIAQFKIAA